jgi:hypothetical protein
LEITQQGEAPAQTARFADNFESEALAVEEVPAPSQPAEMLGNAGEGLNQGDPGGPPVLESQTPAIEPVPAESAESPTVPEREPFPPAEAGRFEEISESAAVAVDEEEERKGREVASALAAELELRL